MTVDEQVNILRDKAKEISAQCIVYVFDNALGGQGGGFDNGADVGDALVMIKRICQRFNINIDALH